MAGPTLNDAQEAINGLKMLDTLYHKHMLEKGGDAVLSRGGQNPKDSTLYQRLANPRNGTFAERKQNYADLNKATDALFGPMRYVIGVNQTESPEVLDKKYGNIKGLQGNPILSAPTLAAKPSKSIGRQAAELATGVTFLKMLRGPVHDSKYKDEMNMDLEAAQQLNRQKARWLQVLTEFDKTGYDAEVAQKGASKELTEARNDAKAILTNRGGYADIDFEETIQKAQRIISEVDEHYYRRVKQQAEIGYGKASMYEEKTDHKNPILHYMDHRGFYATAEWDPTKKTANINIVDIPMFSKAGRLHAAGNMLGAFYDKILEENIKLANAPEDKDKPKPTDLTLEDVIKNNDFTLNHVPTGYPYEGLAFLANSIVIAQAMGGTLKYDKQTLMKGMDGDARRVFEREFDRNLQNYIATAKHELNQHVYQKERFQTTTEVPKRFGKGKKLKTEMGDKKFEHIGTEATVIERYTQGHIDKSLTQESGADLKGSVDKQNPNANAATVSGEDASAGGRSALQANAESLLDPHAEKQKSALTGTVEDRHTQSPDVDSNSRRGQTPGQKPSR